MAITIIEGIVGAGKSVVLTHHGYKAHCRGEVVYANYHLSFPHKRLNLKEIVKGLPLLRDATILLDEAQNTVSARSFMSSNNLMFSKFVKQTRKAGIDLFCATQQAIGIDIDIRRNLHVLETVYPYRLVTNSDGARTMRKATLWEIENRHVDRIVIKKTLYWAEESDKPAPIKWSVLDPTKYFKMYDTRETFDI
jgi:hypothetical protein